MDDKFVDEMNELAEQAIIAFKKLADALQTVVDSISNFAEEINSAVADCIERYENMKKEREKWIVQKFSKIRPLLLDKRSKVHRCRNCC